MFCFTGLIADPPTILVPPSIPHLHPVGATVVVEDVVEEVVEAVVEAVVETVVETVVEAVVDVAAVVGAAVEAVVVVDGSICILLGVNRRFVMVLAIKVAINAGMIKSFVSPSCL